MDAVYVVRPGDRNEELRYSIRSLENVPHDNVWIVGYKPGWLDGVGYIRTHRQRSKYKTSTANLLAACNTDEISEDFILMNDDFYILNPIQDIPVLNRGPVSEVLEWHKRRRWNGPYLHGMKQTAAALKKHRENPISFELHVPMVVNRRRFIESFKAAPRIPVLHKRTWYGNFIGLEGETVKDCKVSTNSKPLDMSRMFGSTSDVSFRGKSGKQLAERFPEPSRYELD